MLVGLVGSRLALRRLHVLEVRGSSLGNGEPLTVPGFLNGLDAGAVRFQFEGLAPGAVYDFGAIFDLLALSSVLPPLDVVVSLVMKLTLSVHANLVAEFTVRLHDGGVEVPISANFDFFQDIDASFAAVAIAAFRHVCNPLF